MSRYGALLLLSLLGAPAALDAQSPSWRRYPSSVPLESGDTLVLGERVPERVAAASTLDRSGRQLVRARPAGIFAGAASVRVTAREGQIRYLEVHFAPTVEFEAVYARLVEAIGPPPDGRSPDPEEPVFWSGRDATLVSLESYTLDSGERVTAVSLFARSR